MAVHHSTYNVMVLINCCTQIRISIAWDISHRIFICFFNSFIYPINLLNLYSLRRQWRSIYSKHCVYTRKINIIIDRFLASTEKKKTKKTIAIFDAMQLFHRQLFLPNIFFQIITVAGASSSKIIAGGTSKIQSNSVHVLVPASLSISLGRQVHFR